MDGRDTICALATGHLPSAIAVIRVSGPAVQDICKRCLGMSLLPRRATLASLSGTDKEQIDEVIATHFRGPASFTGEDVLEISVHGGISVVEAALDAICGIPGVRLAQRGEFTRRAVEAGKFDLIEAEAVADLIDAGTPAQRRQALHQLKGVTSKVIDGWRVDLIEALALLEVTVDFPDEEDAPDYTSEPVRKRLAALSHAFGEVLGEGQVGEQIRDGFRVVLLGAPNVGKSSLLNRLAGRDAAIVTDIPGTTRDTIEVRLNLGGFLVILTDTAGLRDTGDIVELEGVRRAEQAAESADLVLFVQDGSGELEVGPVSDAGSGSARLTVINKCDLLEQRRPSVSRETVFVSAMTGAGLDELTGRMEEIFASIAANAPPAVITRRRHREAMTKAKIALDQAIAGLDTGLGTELVAEDVRQAAHAMGGLIGVIGVEDVLGEIFSSFCIGK